MHNIILKASSPSFGASYAEIRRINGSLNDPRSQRDRMLLNDAQDRAYSEAFSAVKLGNDAVAEQILQAVFEKVTVEYP